MAGDEYLEGVLQRGVSACGYIPESLLENLLENSGVNYKKKRMKKDSRILTYSKGLLCYNL